MDWCDLTTLRWDGYVCVAEESNGPLDEMLTIRILQRHPPMFLNVIHKWEFLQTLPIQTFPSREFLGWDGGTLNRRVGQNLTQKNYTTNITQRPLCDPFITISFAHKAKKSGENWQNGHLLKKSVLSFMEVSSREVCYGYSRNFFCSVGCKQCSCLWIRGLKRQERKWSGAACGNAFIRARACSNVLVLVLVQFIMCLCL